MKKNLLVALLSLSTLTVLTGCFGDKDKHVVVKEETTTVETTPATEDTAAEETVTKEVTVSEEAK